MENLKHSILTIVLIAVVLGILPLFLSENIMSFLTEIFILALCGTALNLLVGGAGVVSFGHAGFFAVGAYTFSLLAYYTNVGFFTSFICAPIVTAIFALICGYFCVKMVDVYFALLALAFSQIVYVFLFNFYEFTKGDDGITGIPIPEALVSINNCYWFVLVVVMICFVIMRIITKSSFGGAATAMRENKERVESIGVNYKKYLLILFVISGTITGIAGSLMAIFMRGAFPTFSGFDKSGEFLLVGIMGGVNYFIGPAVGATIYMSVDHALSGYTEYWLFYMGVLLVAITLYFRGGVVEMVDKKIKSLKIKK